MKRRLAISLVLLLAGLVAACSSQPSDDELRALVVDALDAQGPEAIYRVENFRKINGYLKDDRRYVAEVGYELIFAKGLQNIAAESRNPLAGPLERMGAVTGLMALHLLYGDFKAGDRLPRTQTLHLIKTEQGWHIEEE